MSAEVVLLHGWGGSFASTFAGWTDRIAGLGRRVRPIDLPGHGDAGASRDPRDYADMTALVADRVGHGRFDIIAFSLGAKLALSLAVRFPARVGRIVLGGLGDNAFVPEQHGEAVAAALENGVDTATPEAVAALVRYSQASGSDPLALAAVLRRPPNPRITTEDLARIRVPILLVNGDQDAVARPDAGLRASLPGAAYARLSGIDHIMLPSCEGFRNAALAFLATPETHDMRHSRTANI